MRNFFAPFLPLLIFFAQQSFGQFKNTFAANGNPTTQIIDASGMKQGNWNYYDTRNQVYRAEVFTDHVLTKSIYLMNGAEVNMMAFQTLALSQLKAEAIDFILKKLQPWGRGELIILEDGSVHLHFYVDALKSKTPPEIDLHSIKQLALKSSIIKF